jgi:hypothetical protein
MALAEKEPQCATFRVAGDQPIWVQFVAGTITAAYPFSTPPHNATAKLGACRLMEWQPNKYLRAELYLNSTTSIARWIDSYFTNVLGCKKRYRLDVTLVDLYE